MAIIRYGLNIGNSLAEIENKEEALKNLGLDIRDLDVIRGLSNEVALSQDELKLISNLTIDVKAALISLRSSASYIPYILSNAPTANIGLTSNIYINNQFIAGAFKYDYYDFVSGETKSGDISTSRNSSWSSFENPITNTSPIFYGGDVEIRASSNNKSQLSVTELNTTVTPNRKKYAAEEPTHLITVDVGGTPQQIYAMKGIPLEFECFFKTATFRYSVFKRVNVSTDPTPTITLTYLDNNTVFEYTDTPAPQPLNNLADGLVLTDFKSRSKLLKFYYNPVRISALILGKFNIIAFPKIILPALTRLDLSYNDFKELPNFMTIAPNLKTLTVAGNDLTRGAAPIANAQIATLPITIESLDISGCYSDDQSIDLTPFTNLKTFVFSSAISTSTFRRMKDTGSTPSTYLNTTIPASPTSSLINYTVNYQPYKKLHKNVAESDKLRILDLQSCDIRSDSADAPIVLKSTVLTTLITDYNKHNLIDVNGKAELVTYRHSHSGNLTSDDTTIAGKFKKCTKLQDIRLYNTRVTGNISTEFAELPALTYLDLRYTNIEGKLTSNTFAGSDNITTLLLLGAKFGTTDGVAEPVFVAKDTFVNMTKLSTLHMQLSTNMAGPLPDFTKNTKLSTLNIQNTSFTSGLTAFSENVELRYLYAMNSKLTDTVPAFNSNLLEIIRLENNSLQSDIIPVPEFKCKKLTYLSMNNNKLTKSIPSFANCPMLSTLILSNNQFSSYVPESLSKSIYLKTIDFSNNRLTASDAFQILADLKTNYNSNKRTGVSVNLLGNRFSLNDIINNTVSADIYNSLKGQNWSIVVV